MDESHRRRRRRAGVESISKPLAAFRLGVLSRRIWAFHKLFWDEPDMQGTAANVPLAVEQLRECRLALLDDMNSNAFNDMEKILSGIESLGRSLFDAFRRPPGAHTPRFGEGNAPDNGLRAGLIAVADRSLARSNPLRAQYELGAVLGSFYLELVEQDPAPDEIEDLGRLPDVGPLIWALERMPAAIAADCTAIGMVRASAPAHATKGPAEFFKTLYSKRDKSVWPSYWRASHTGVCRFIEALNEEIEVALRRYEGPHEAGVANHDDATLARLDPDRPDGGALHEGNEAGSEARDEVSTVAVGTAQVHDVAAGEPLAPDKPVFEKAPLGFVLRYRGEIARKVFGHAHALIPILEAFQKRGWPESIEFKDIDTKKKNITINKMNFHSHIRTLNKKVKYLKFVADGRGTGISWVPENSSRTP